MKIASSLLAAALFAVLSTTNCTAAPKEWVGKELPELDLTYLDGKTPALKGNAAIVEFWATWCPPCRTTIPHLNELQKKFKDKGLAIIGITDEEKKEVTDFRKKTPMNYHVALDKDGKISQKFGITGIPHAFLVAKDGKILWQGHPMELNEAEIEKALK